MLVEEKGTMSYEEYLEKNYERLREQFIEEQEELFMNYCWEAYLEQTDQADRELELLLEGKLEEEKP